MLSNQARKVDYEKPDAAAAEWIKMTERACYWGANLRPGFLAYAVRFDNESFARFFANAACSGANARHWELANWVTASGCYLGARDLLEAAIVGEHSSYGPATDLLAANAHDFIKAFPKGYEVGESGVQLSGRLKQCVAIARAIIKDPAILLLDKATSALDSESEKVVQVTIAHRLWTIQSCDRIAVIAGKCVEGIGTHAELTARGGLYPKLCELQGGGHSTALSTATAQQPPSAAAALSAAPSPANAAVSALKRQSSARESSTSAWPGGHQGGGGKGGGKGDKRAEPLAPLGRIWALQRQDLGWVLMGICGSILLGSSVSLAQVQSSFYLPTASQIQDKGCDSVLAFVGLAASTVVGHVIEALAFAVSGERLTRRMREMAFKAVLRDDIGRFDNAKHAILRHDIGWFDNAEHAVGVLTTSLEADASAMALATGMDVGHKFGLIALLVRSMVGERGALANGVAFGYSQGVLLWIFALLFWFGSILASNGAVTFLNFYMTMFAIVLGGMGIGHVEGDLGAQRAGRAAAARIFALVDDELKIDPLSDGGARPIVRAQSAIAYRNVHFTYPTRPEQAVYGGAGAPEGFSLDTGAGEMAALVGPSGSGKSTCIVLLMRCYDVSDVSEGSVELDGCNVKELNVHWLRSQVGYVGQEPVLFTGSIRDNIARGHPSATAEEIESAARAANAHDFVTAFAEGYDTDVGEKSALLSGGQKQRIAIARAILKNPAILLLDEATSALDNESERQVQAALDCLRALQKCTTLVVAHRLSTIRNADKIAVLGSHDDLVILSGGLYASLYNHQTAAFGH
ncbi:P-loop containing nucleoside triphosphate hydrolase protein [Tribonema minus]|uniref:P-loop containing nucleoside triphosphate hydrolase protein n=1 Tax=Tribonema minus TaxID=303371 RepID=A0A835ZHI0_9STRA|nr:P-loop containing nucleoside triphosphate hydrolase protein [Tribonema minus]